MKTLLSEGIRSGEIGVDAPSTAMLARCVVGLQWIPENILRDVGKRAGLVHARDTVLRGVAVRGK
ncbi:tetR family transcriptional regulator domain protein [Mycobacterium intracellulare]|nr:tetR family transcriptional regulator domain protein [Mycobacterium intracellulare]